MQSRVDRLHAVRQDIHTLLPLRGAQEVPPETEAASIPLPNVWKGEFSVTLPDTSTFLPVPGRAAAVVPALITDSLCSGHFSRVRAFKSHGSTKTMSLGLAESMFHSSTPQIPQIFFSRVLPQCPAVTPAARSHVPRPSRPTPTHGPRGPRRHVFRSDSYHQTKLGLK